MAKLLKEAALDDRFNVQMKKAQGALDVLTDIIEEMNKPGSMTKATSGQKMQLKHAAEDFKRLHDKV